MQPWTFCIVQSDKIKRAIRECVEEQEQMNYSRRMGAQWVLDVAHLNVNWNKPYLTEAPFLIVVMKHVSFVVIGIKKIRLKFFLLAELILQGNCNSIT